MLSSVAGQSHNNLSQIRAWQQSAQEAKSPSAEPFLHAETKHSMFEKASRELEQDTAFLQSLDQAGGEKPPMYVPGRDGQQLAVDTDNRPGEIEVTGVGMLKSVPDGVFMARIISPPEVTDNKSYAGAIRAFNLNGNGTITVTETIGAQITNGRMTGLPGIKKFDLDQENRTITNFTHTVSHEDGSVTNHDVLGYVIKD